MEFFLTTAEQQWLETEPVIEIPFDLEGAPFAFINEHGEAVGILVDLMKDLQRYAPVRIEYRPEYYSQVVDHIKHADRAVVTGFDPMDYPAYKESYLKTESILYMPFSLFALEGRDPASFNTENMKGKRVAIIEGWNLDHPALEPLGDAELVFCQDDTQGINMVLNGEVDALYEATSMVAYLLNKNMVQNMRIVQVTKFGFPLSVLVRKDHQLFFDILQRYLEALGAEKRARMLDKWTSGVNDTGFHLFSFWLNDRERQWLATNQVIRVGSDPHWRPVDWRDDSGQQVGISADYIQQLQQLLKTRFEFVQVENWAEALEKFKRREVDLLSSVAKNERREAFIDFTDPYLDLTVKIYVKQGGYINNLSELEGKRLAVPKGYAVSDDLRRDYPDIILVEVDTVEDSIEALLAGKADAFVGTILTTTHILSQQGIYEVKVGGDTPYAYELALGTQKHNPILGSIIKKALRMISPGERARIYNKWTPLPPPPIDYSLLWELGIPLVLLLFAVMGWNWMLKREVKRRTADLHKMTAELRETADRLIDAEEIAAMGHWKLDHQSKKMICSQEMLHICGITDETMELHFEDYQALVHTDDLDSLLHEFLVSIRDRVNFRHEHRICPARGEIKPVLMQCRTIYDVSGVALTSMGILQDMTEQKQTQAKALQTEKMQAVGELAGGVAHDFKNMLSGIIGASELLSNELADRPDLSEYNNIILYAADRASQLTQKLLAFSRKKDVILVAVDLHRVIEESVDLMKRSVGRMITIEQDLADEQVFVTADPSQLGNTILNLGINALHAMEQGGVLSFKTQIRRLSKAECDASRFEITPGRFVEIEVRDTGCGIAPEILPRIYEPFFTTKEEGKGTGLGLASVYGTIQYHHGSIQVKSEVGRGSVFTILLPLADADSRSLALSKRETIQHRPGTILVVEDELILRVILEAMLQDFGHTVLLAENGAEAVEIYTKRQHEIDLVILDMIMPVMNGKECFFQIRQINSTANIILASGFSTPDDVKLMREKGLKAMISKPYNRRELSRVIDQVMAPEASVGVTEGA